jgi:Protein kinase domain
VQEKNRMYLIMEYCAGGDLAGYLRRSKRLPEAAAQALMQQLGAGLKVLRDNNLVHVRAPGHGPAVNVPFLLPALAHAGVSFQEERGTSLAPLMCCGVQYVYVPHRQDRWAVACLPEG